MSQTAPAPTVPPPPRPAVRLYGLLLALTIAGGCQPDTGSTPDAFEDNLWTLSERELRIGSVDDPDYLIGFIAGMALGPDGLLYTLEWGEGSIRRWTPDGAPAGTIGRMGEGPGEFEQPTNLGFFGDSLWVWDMDAYRVNYFDLDGEFLGSVSPKVQFGSAGQSPPRPGTPLRDRTFIGTSPAWSHAIANGTLTESTYAHMDADGIILAEIWAMPLEPRDQFAIMNDDGIGGRFGNQPFGDGYSASIGNDGLLVLEARAWTGTGDPAVTVTKIGLTGDTVFTAPVPYDPVPLSAERFDSAVAAMTEDWSGFGEPVTEARIREAMYRPAYLPAVARLMRAADGTIWLRRFDPVQSETGESMTESWVLNAEGAPLARALFPADLRVAVIDGDTVWGIEMDELDVQYIVRYRLVKGG